jgi:hypothetical protein
MVVSWGLRGLRLERERVRRPAIPRGLVDHGCRVAASLAEVRHESTSRAARLNNAAHRSIRETS